ncbi:MAG: hypothetical protein QY318_01365 [Candidatus Dojkabacteria bacterium]|nr:MAG: hypothetical protein QY318_01365 [Candidatus Dojkabacteria bacterium]
MSNIPVEIITLIFLFIGFHLLFFMAAGVLEQGQIGLSWRELFSAVKFSLIEVAIYFALKTVVSKISESSHSTIKL